MTSALRERSREILRAELAEAALDYFASRDFDAVTVEEVAHAIGISRASFFRYFGSKEDAVVAAVYAGHLDFPRILAEQDHVGISPWMRLRRMFDASTAAAHDRPDDLRQRVQLIESTPGLRARLNERRLGQRTGVAEALVSEATSLRTARALVASAFAVVDVAWNEWVAQPGSSLGVILDELFEAMEPRRPAT